MSQPEGWTNVQAKNNYINCLHFRVSSAVEPVSFKRRKGNWDKVKTPRAHNVFDKSMKCFGRKVDTVAFYPFITYPIASLKTQIIGRDARR